MSVATSLSEARGRRAGAEIVALRRPAVAGEAVLGVREVDGVTRLAELYQRDPLSLRLPQPEPGDILEASLITTSGGIVGGDLMTLLYTAQLAAISQDPWFSRVQSPLCPDYAAIDLDPPFADQLFTFAAAADARGGQHLLQSLSRLIIHGGRLAWQGRCGESQIVLG